MDPNDQGHLVVSPDYHDKMRRLSRETERSMKDLTHSMIERFESEFRAEETPPRGGNDAPEKEEGETEEKTEQESVEFVL